MKRLLILSLLVAGALGLSSAGLALAGQGFNMMSGGRGAGNTAMLENKAAVFGITVDELKNQIAAGKTFYGLMQEKGLSFNDLHNRAKERVQTQLAELVKNGDITQKQMDRQLQFMDEHHAEAMVSGGAGMMGGRGHGFGRMGW